MAKHSVVPVTMSFDPAQPVHCEQLIDDLRQSTAENDFLPDRRAPWEDLYSCWERLTLMLATHRRVPKDRRLICEAVAAALNLDVRRKAPKPSARR